MPNLNDIEQWKNLLGLLPIQLSSYNFRESKYILLNGGYGDFCLQINENEENDEFYFSSAWSSSTKNFVTFNEQNLNIYNWKKSKVEKLPSKSVSENFDKFYDYLVENSFSTELDVVPFIISIFRKLRNLVNDRHDGLQSLNLLFFLLASLEEDISNINAEKWGINQSELISELPKYIEEFKSGMMGIRPNLDLIIRHTSGILFQEAQKEVIFFDKQRELFSNTLSSLVLTKKQLYSSIHYTPAYLARTIVENALNKLDLDKETLKIFDPACGSSEFLMEALKQLRAKNFQGTVHIIGWDSSPTAINTSRFLLTYEKREWQERLILELKQVEDSLTEKWDHDYDCILMNPPFVSWELMELKYRDSVRDALDNVFDGKPNQASAFFYKSILSLNKNGVIGTVIPSSILASDAYNKLRKSLHGTLSISILGRLGNFVFEDALTDVGIIVGSKSSISDIPLLIWTKNEKGIARTALRDLRKLSYSNRPIISEKTHSIYHPAVFPISDLNWNITSFNDNEFLKKIELFVSDERLVRIGDVFNVQQGSRTGLNNILKISKTDFDFLPNDEKNYFKPAIDNEAINRGMLRKINYIWYPYDRQGLIITNEQELSELTPTFYKRWLLPNRAKLEKRAGIKVWWELTRPRKWQFETKKTLCSTEFGKSNSFAFDLKGEFIIERGNAWLPKRSFKKNDYYYFYLAVFSSSMFDKLLSIYSKQLLSGWDLGKKYTKDIPIPSVYSSDISESIAFERLVQLGKQLSKGELITPYPIDELLNNYIYPSSY